MASSNLIVHCMIPGGADEALAARFFNVALPPLRRMRLSDPMHEARRRWPDALGAPPAGLRLISGHVPIGYFDAVAAHRVHVCTLVDPEAAFLRFAARLPALSPEALLRLTGFGPAALASDDRDETLLRLLAEPRVRRGQIGAMTRLCAGLARVAPAGAEPEPTALLRAARANLARINVLAGAEEEVDAFAAYLAATLGWAPPPLSPSAGLPAVDARDLPPAVRDALRAAVDLDLRLYEGARDMLCLQPS